jgi:hypothetical protein
MAQSQRPSSTIPPIGSNKRAGPAGHSDKAHLAVGAQCDGDRVRLCRRLAFGASLGIIQLVHLSPRQHRGFLDGLLSRERAGIQPA